MSGGGAGGPQRGMTIKQKSHSHPGGGIKKKSEVDVTSMLEARSFKMGLLVDAGQAVTLAITSPPGFVLTQEGAGGPVRAELNTAFPPASGKAWVAFTGTYKHAFGKKFETDIVVSPFNVPPHAFQVLTLVFTYTQKSFVTDHYILATSCLLGSNATAVGIGEIAGSKKAPAPSKKKPPAKSKKPKPR